MEIDQESELRVRVAELDRENSLLRSRVESYTSAVPTEPVPAARPRGRWWTVLAAFLIVLGCLMAPLAVVTGWAKSTLTDTETFVATYGPLARNPEVQGYVVDQVTTVIDQRVDLAQYVSQIVDGIKESGRPRASAALDALKEPLIRSVQSVVLNGVEDFVASDT